MMAHNVYLNLDFKPDDLACRPKKLKAYVAPGNNGAMIKGLISRRFWWSLSDERTPDCDFVWTQIKINEIFANQEKLQPGKAVLKNWEPDSPTKLSKTSTKIQYGKKIGNEEEFNSKVLNEEDSKIYKRYRNRYENGRER